MKKLITIGCVALFALGICLMVRGYIGSRRIINQITNNNKHQSDTVTEADTWHDRWKTEHAEKVAIQGTLKSLEITDAAQLDVATQRVQIQRRQIEGLQKVVVDLKGKFTSEIIRDSTGTHIKYKDSTISAIATVVGDSVDVEYSVTAPIFLTQYWKRKWLLSKKTHYVDGYSTNPNVHITNLQSIRINSVEPGRFGVGPYLGIGYDGVSFKPSLGICISYSLFRF